MSQFYDLASLVVIPSGYKASTIYAQKPLTTDGQLSFTRASTATRVNSSGLIEAVASNVPRLDYLGSTCPRLLLEGQRTNKCPNSANYGNSLINVTVTRNVVSAPTNSVEADRVLDDNANGEHLLAESFDSILNAQPYTVSCFFKADGTGGRAVIRFYVGSWTYAVYNLANGTITATDGVGTASIQNYGSGWYRCILTATAATDYTPMVTQLGIANSSNNFSYQGATSLGVYFWGYQAEQGAYVSSIIPTAGASATRGADAASKTGISSLIGQTEGVAFIDFVWNGLTGIGSYPRIIELATDSSNIIQLFSISGTTSWNWEIINGGVVQFTGSSTMALGRNKIAIGYKLNDMVVYKNGALIASDATCTVPATSALGVTGTFNGAGGAQLAASVNQTLLFKTRLTNAQLAELTTL
jgi:hypothetical protein